MKRLLLALAGGAALFLAPSASFAQGADPFLGQLALFPYNFCPQGWTETNGQLLSIAQNSALFALLGTTYGGNGQTTFGLPDLRGRTPVHQGQGTGLANVVLGQVFGSESTTLTINQMPAHSHTLMGSTGDPDWRYPTGNTFPTYPPTVAQRAYSDDNANVAMKSTNIASTGGSQPFDQHQPSLGLRYCIALQGIFPSQNN